MLQFEVVAASAQATAVVEPEPEPEPEPEKPKNEEDLIGEWGSLDDIKARPKKGKSFLSCS